jgi:prophage maintenance system killer protein
LFHSITCNHCFHNGNKRTALVTLDLFLSANSAWLLATGDQLYELAKSTARHNEDGVTADEALGRVVAFISTNSVKLATVRRHLAVADTDSRIRPYYEKQVQIRKDIRSHPLNERQIRS